MKVKRPQTGSLPGSCMRPVLLTLLLAAAAARVPVPLARAEAPPPPNTEGTTPERLLTAYPDQLQSISNGMLVWRNGTPPMPLDDGKGKKSFADWLADADIEDMFRFAYSAGVEAAPPPPGFDPGRARNAAFFDRIYGDCRTGSVTPNLTTIVWLPTKKGQRLQVTRINSVDKKLEAVSAELDQLGPEFDVFLSPSEGTYNCRVIAGTQRVSAHGYGIAIDIATRRAHYWRWAASKAADTDQDTIAFRNEIPMEIVRIFEKHGFIWGGRWHHYDTMHFEYRPELLPEVVAAPPQGLGLGSSK